jgi:hypothetical protein
MPLYIKDICIGRHLYKLLAPLAPESMVIIIDHVEVHLPEYSISIVRMYLAEMIQNSFPVVGFI